MKKKLKSFLLKNSIHKKYFNNNLYLKDKKKLNKIIKHTYDNLDEIKDTFHVLSKKFILDFNKANLNKFNKYQTVLVIGMGGSVIGSNAIYNFLKKKINKKFIFLDNLDFSKIEKIKKKLNFKNSLIIIISKSGNTIETLVNSNLIKDKISSKNTIIITEQKKIY